jgi:hypothetical protein
MSESIFHCDLGAAEEVAQKPSSRKNTCHLSDTASDQLLRVLNHKLRLILRNSLSNGPAAFRHADVMFS